MAKSLQARLQESLNVSGTFDNCFFHAYSAHLLANKQPVDHLFTFKSILGSDSPASQLQQKLVNSDLLTLFKDSSNSKNSQQAPISPNFIVEQTLVLGILMREWFATQMAMHPEISDSMETTVISNFDSYREFRWYDTPIQDLLLCENGVLYTANESFLEYFTNRYLLKNTVLTPEQTRFEQYFEGETTNNEAIKAYWKNEGYKNYYQLLAQSSTKLSSADIAPVIEFSGQGLTIYSSNSERSYSNEGVLGKPQMELLIQGGNGHYHLLKTDETNALLNEYEDSYKHYLLDREAILKTPGDKNSVAESTPSLLVKAICPENSFNKKPFDLLLDKIDDLSNHLIAVDVTETDLLNQQKVEAKPQVAKQQETKQQEVKQQETKQQETKQQETKQQEAKQQEAKQQEAKQQEAKQQEAKQQEAKQQEAKQQEAKQQEAKQQEAKQQISKQREFTRRAEASPKSTVLENNSEQHLPSHSKTTYTQEQSAPNSPSNDQVTTAVQAKKDFYTQLEILKNKSKEFETRKVIALKEERNTDYDELNHAQHKANTLYSNLKMEGDIYFNNPNPKAHNKFQTECKRHIGEARPILEKHRGWGQVFINILIAVACALIFYPLALGINKAVTGNYLFFKTDSADKLDEIEKTVNNTKPGA
jgi:hypothetical protein